VPTARLRAMGSAASPPSQTWQNSRFCALDPLREAGEPIQSPSHGAGRDLSRHGPDRVQGHDARRADLAR
jgi:hypothetical protein